MKTAASAQDLTVPNTEQALTTLPSSAQQQIEALRAAIDVRLAALDAVLADPTRGESLETLILDLARLATEEARAVTTRVCVGIKLEADNELAQVRRSAQQSLEQERIVSSDFRRSLEQAEQRYATLEREKQTELRALRDSFDAKLANDRVAVDALERSAATLELALAEASKKIDAERARAEQFHDETGRAEAHAADVMREHHETRQALAQAEAALRQEQQKTADGAKAHAATQGDLAAERATVAELRGAMERTRGQASTIDRDREESKKAQAALEAELVRERKIAGELERKVRDIEQSLQKERAGQAAGQDELREALLAARGNAQKLHDELEAERSGAKPLRARLEQLEARASRADKDAAQHAAVQEELRQALQTARNERQLLATQIEAERKIAAELRGRLDQLAQQVKSGTADANALGAARQSLAAAEANIEQLRRELGSEQKSAHDRRQEIDRLNQQLSQASNQAATQDELRQSVVTANSEALRARTELETEKKAARAGADELRKQLQTALSDTARLRDELDVERSGSHQLKQRLDDLGNRLSRAADETVQHAAGSDELRAAVLDARSEAARLRADLEAEREQRRTLEQEVLRSMDAATTAAGRVERQRADQETLEQTLAASLIEHEKLVLQLDTERARIHDLERAQASADQSWREAEERLEAAMRDRLAAAPGAGPQKQTAPKAAAAPAPPAAKPVPAAASASVATEAAKGKSAPAAPAAPASGKTAAAYALNDEGWTQVRMSTRYAFRDKIEIQINNGSGWLSDLSIGGCQLVSRTALKPKQSLKITLPLGAKGLLCTGKVVWARVEPPTPGQPLSYRGGVQFSNADQSAIESFLASHGVEL